MHTPKTLLLNVRILNDAREAHEIWASFSENSAKTVYQTPEFLNSWLETVGHSDNINPLFIFMEDVKGGKLFLPLGIKKNGVIKTAQFLGGKHANFNIPIFNDSALNWDGAQIKAALVKAGKLANIDVFSFKNQPLSWQGTDNPFAKLQSQPSPSFGYGLGLLKDPDILISTRLSKEGRKKLRHKEKSISKLGNIQFLEALNSEQYQKMLNAYFDQKSLSFNSKNLSNPFEDQYVQNWLKNAKFLRLYAIELNGEYLSIWGVGHKNGHVSGMFTSYDIKNEAARSSPGEVLLVWIIRKLCFEGYHSIDFGVGEARYKDIWCDTRIELFDTYLSTGLTGFGPAVFMKLKGRVKRFVKQSSFASRIFNRAKSTLRFR